MQHITSLMRTPHHILGHHGPRHIAVHVKMERIPSQTALLAKIANLQSEDGLYNGGGVHDDEVSPQKWVRAVILCLKDKPAGHTGYLDGVDGLPWTIEGGEGLVHGILCKIELSENWINRRNRKGLMTLPRIKAHVRGGNHHLISHVHTGGESGVRLEARHEGIIHQVHPDIIKG